MEKSSLNKLKKYGQYKYDIFSKLDFDFIPGARVLDLGCGDGSDSAIFKNVFGLKVFSCDIYEHEDVKKNKLKFQLAGIYKLPYKSNFFGYVFMHDVLHHIDEPEQRMNKHISGLVEALRVLKPGGTMVIVEANRYNPLFYPHMVKMRGHNHFKQSYFKKLVNGSFKSSDVTFKFFEAHVYPKKLLKLFKIYERVMDNFMPKSLLAYNIVLVKK